MPPPKSKFVAPVRKIPGLSSDSWSGSSYTGSFTQEVSSNIPSGSGNVSAGPVSAEEAAKPSFQVPQFTTPKAKENQDSTEATSKAKEGSSNIKKPFMVKSSENTTAEKRKTEPTASTSKPKKSKLGSDNKENVTLAITNDAKTKEKKTKARTEPSKPTVPLTDEDYDNIFQAVLSKGKDADSESAKPSENESEDLFNFSQSDLDDSEGEESTSHVPLSDISVKKAVENALLLVHTPSPRKQSQNTAATKKCDNIIPLDTPSAAKDDLGKSRTEDLPSKKNPIPVAALMVEDFSNSQTIPGSPCITFMSSSQPFSCNSSVAVKAENISMTEEHFSQESKSFLRSESFVATSTPQDTRQSSNNLASSPFVTPQKVIDSRRPSVQSQLCSPAGSFSNLTQSTKPTTANANNPISDLNLSRSSSVSRSLTHSAPNTPKNSLQISSKVVSTTSSPQPKQDNPTPSTPSNSQQSTTKPLSLNLTVTPSRPKQGTPAPSTPSNSQQHFSQDLELTPPPPKLTARERLLWLQKKRLAGVWVQCDREECGKWRYLPDIHDPTTLPETWSCSMHPDNEQNDCDAPQKRLSLHAEEDMIFNKYSPGSLVWARLPGYPWWPAMIEDDPDLEQFYWLNLFSDIPTWYHVVFFDDKDYVHRAWIQVERLKDFKGKQLDFMGEEADSYKKRLRAAFQKACHAMSQNLEERLVQYSFASCYKGVIGGGSSKRTYEGPAGFRKAVTK